MIHEQESLGGWGEKLAIEYLQKHGCRILATNYSNRFGEIDIIARDKEQMCFIEVKTRASSRYGSPWDAVNHIKRKKLANMALMYLQELGYDDEYMRFDVIAIIKKQQKEYEIDWLKDAFECDF